MLEPRVLDLDWRSVNRRIRSFIKDYLEKSRRKGVVLGLSGGIDSCTTSALCALAVGGDNVTGLLLPEKETYRVIDITHARLVAEKFGFKTEEVDITPLLNKFYSSCPIFDSRDRLSKGNAKARSRMIYLYYYANRLNLLVCGTSDKSETMMGYFTKWGDMASDISPIMDLYKTQVRRLAEHLGIPKEIVNKPASPMLWPGQLAREELGMDYETLDLILFGLERFLKPEEIAQQMDIEVKAVKKIKRRYISMTHKRKTPLTIKIQYRTMGVDMRLPRVIYE
ncbi:MAG: NAD+ synthase [Candidatus Bathyarchaeota archaeon]